MANYSNLFLQALVEANDRRNRAKREEEELLKELEKEEIEDDIAEEQKDEADADAEEALTDLGEPSDEELDDQEQEALEAEAEDMENLDDPNTYDPFGDEDEPDESEVPDEELEALEAEDNGQNGEESTDELPPEDQAPQGEPTGENMEQTPEDQPPEGDVPDPNVDDDSIDFDYDDNDNGNAPAEGDVPQGDGAEAAPQDPNAPPDDPNAPPPEEAADQQPPDPDTQNIQVNILNLSKLDRALAKKHIYTLFMDLRSSVTTALNVIDRNETVIDPDIRNDVITRLNQFQADLNTFISIKFQLINYEAAFNAYNIFTEQFKSYLDSIKTGDSDDSNVKHTNKGNR